MGSRRDRYREIVETLSVHGFGFTIGAMGRQGRFPFRRGLPGHPHGRTYSQPEHLRLALEQLGPTFVKLGQLLSTRSDLLPPEYTVELANLQDDTAAVPTEVILEALAEEVGDLAVRQDCCGPGVGTTALAAATSGPRTLRHSPRREHARAGTDGGQGPPVVPRAGSRRRAGAGPFASGPAQDEPS